MQDVFEYSREFSVQGEEANLVYNFSYWAENPSPCRMLRYLQILGPECTLGKGQDLRRQ
jgi:hypothetical protein